MLTVLAAPGAAATTQVDCRAGADLQDALDAASPGDTLAIRGTCVGNFTVTVADLTLEGRAAHPTIRGLAGSPALETFGPLAIRKLTIAEGSGIVANGDLIVIDSTIRDSDGTGVVVVLGLEFTLRDSTVRDNGGIGVWGTGLRIERSTFRGNGLEGLYTGSDTSVSDSVFKDNAGGGITTVAGNHFGLGGTVTVTRTRIIDNGGSGIHNRHALLVRDSIIRGNHTSGFGGGIFNDLDGGLTLIDSRVIKNSAVDGGGIYDQPDDPYGVHILEGSVIRNNRPNDCTNC
jgi:hypothetical protein